MATIPKTREAGIETAFGIIGDDADGLKLEGFLQTLPEDARTVVISLVNSARGTLRKQKELSDIIAGLHGDIRILRDEVNLYKKRDLEAALPVDGDDTGFQRAAVSAQETRRRAVHAYAQALLPSFLGRVQKFGDDAMSTLANAACALFEDVDDAATTGYGWGDNDDLFAVDDEDAAVENDEPDGPEISFTVPRGYKADEVSLARPPRTKTRKAKKKAAKKKAKR